MRNTLLERVDDCSVHKRMRFLCLMQSCLHAAQYARWMLWWVSSWVPRYPTIGTSRMRTRSRQHGTSSYHMSLGSSLEHLHVLSEAQDVQPKQPNADMRKLTHECYVMSRHVSLMLILGCSTPAQNSIEQVIPQPRRQRGQPACSRRSA